LIGIQVIVGRWVVSREFLYSVHGLFETFNGFQPTRTSRRVVFENFVPNRIAHDTSPTVTGWEEQDVVRWNGRAVTGVSLPSKIIRYESLRFQAFCIPAFVRSGVGRIPPNPMSKYRRLLGNTENRRFMRRS
jgi:hypothetical protein